MSSPLRIEFPEVFYHVTFRGKEGYGLMFLWTSLRLNLVGGLGMPLAEVARALGVSTSAISKLLSRKDHPPL